jgi:hypothetical protein
MEIKLYQAKLRTANKTPDDIIWDFGDNISEQEIQNWLKTYKAIDGLEIVVFKSLFNENDYTLFTWNRQDEKVWRDFMYLSEQDSSFGNYVDDWETFLEDWNSGDYSPSGILAFGSDDVEIIKELEKRGVQNDR